MVVHRADGSGTSYAWTDYLSKTSPSGRRRWVQPDSEVANGPGANGNDGVAKLVKELGGSIGYVEFIYALQNHLSFGKVRNQNGEFVGASLESIAAAAEPCASIERRFQSLPGGRAGSGRLPDRVVHVVCRSRAYRGRCQTKRDSWNF